MKKKTVHKAATQQLRNANLHCVVFCGTLMCLCVCVYVLVCAHECVYVCVCACFLITMTGRCLVVVWSRGMIQSEV